MKKIILAAVIILIALVLFITLKPKIVDLIALPPASQVDASQEQLLVEPSPYFEVVQGDSALALTVMNNSDQIVSFSLGHEHAYLTFQPQGDRIAPGIKREVSVFVDPQCPAGEILLPVYLRTEVNGERVGMDIDILMSVSEGELALLSEDYRLVVLWNGETAPRGVFVSYRAPGTEEWRNWGETPRIDPPENLSPGTYQLEFMAELGSIISSVETLEIVVEEPPAKIEPEPEPEPVEKKVKAQPVEEKEEQEAPSEPELPKPGTREYLVWIWQQQNPVKEEKEEEEEELDWWQEN